jgi:hypothetical protein
MRQAEPVHEKGSERTWKRNAEGMSTVATKVHNEEQRMTLCDDATTAAQQAQAAHQSTGDSNKQANLKEDEV